MTPEQKARNAEARVTEVWDALTRIEQLRDRVRVLIENHDPTKGDNASRRDCERFRERCRELGLTDWAAAATKSGLLDGASVDAVAPRIVDFSAAPAMLEALEAAIECGMVPISSASEGGAPRHSRQVQVADMIRAAIAAARGRN